MTQKRFEATYFDCQYVTDHKTRIDYPVLSEFEYANDLCNLLNEQDQQIKETKDMFYEAHKQQQDCLKEVIKLKEEKRELEFKLGTLIKAYSRRNCAFNGKETEYLKSLRK